MKKILVLLFLVCISVNISVSQTLFHIARNLNKNVINYDIQLDNGKIDQKEPLHVYWYNLEKHPATTNELNFIQRKMAYGYKTIKVSDTDATIKLKAYKDRSMHVCKYKGTWVAVIQIFGKDCILQEIYAHCPSKTSCDWIELRGKNMQTGQVQKERINN